MKLFRVFAFSVSTSNGSCDQKEIVDFPQDSDERPDPLETTQAARASKNMSPSSASMRSSILFEHSIPPLRADQLTPMRKNLIELSTPSSESEIDLGLSNSNPNLQIPGPSLGGSLSSASSADAFTLQRRTSRADLESPSSVELYREEASSSRKNLVHDTEVEQGLSLPKEQGQKRKREELNSELKTVEESLKERKSWRTLPKCCRRRSIEKEAFLESDKK